MKLNILVSTLLLICLSNSSIAQEKPELFSNIERVFQEREPAWKVERTHPGSSTSDPLTQSITFRSGKNQAAIDVNIWNSEKDARDVFAGQSLAFDNIRGKGTVKRSLPNLGDENHLWTNRGSAAWPTIRFRKGNINVMVFAPSLAIARRFAQHILEQIAAG